MKIAVVSAYTENIKDLYKITSKTLVEYCKLHNYHLLISKIVETERPAPWYKLTEILKCLVDGFDIVLWVDCDAIIVNKKIKIEDLIEEDKDFYYASNWLGMNSGVMIFRNTDDVKNFLIESWSQEQFVLHPWWEQAAIRHLLERKAFPLYKIKELPASILNSEEYYGGCLVYHMPETCLNERIKRFSEILGSQQ